MSQLEQDFPELFRAHFDHRPFNKYWKVILNFAAAEYFERIWIFQELWAAYLAQTVFLCGDEHLPMHSLIRYRAWADSCWAQHNDDRVPIGFMISMFPLISQIYGMKAGRLKEVGATRLFLHTVRQSRSKDPRDKVFALFSIFQIDLTPDYTMPVADV